MEDLDAGLPLFGWEVGQRLFLLLGIGCSVGMGYLSRTVVLVCVDELVFWAIMPRLTQYHSLVHDAALAGQIPTQNKTLSVVTAVKWLYLRQAAHGSRF